VTHAEICPVCRGTGKFLGEDCHGCPMSRGWVEVSDPLPSSPLYPPPVQPYLGGWTCARCNIWVPSGTVHFCLAPDFTFRTDTCEVKLTTGVTSTGVTSRFAV